MPNAAAKPTITDSAKIHVYASNILAQLCDPSGLPALQRWVCSQCLLTSLRSDKQLF